MGCPDEEALAAFGEGRLTPRHRAELEHHLDGCDTCAALLASAVRGTTAAVAEPPSPSSASRYVLGRPLGRGGFADVFEAHDRELDRTVAVKVLRTDGHANNPEVRARLAREAQALARLSHPDIVEVYDVALGEQGETLLVMALVRGTTLRAWLEQPRSWPEIREVFLAAGRGLAAAHAVGIVHRDFKPANVMVGDDGRVRVLDFGLARGSDDDLPSEPSATTGSGSGMSTRLTQSGAVMGTPMYMAPEQHLGRPADARSDQYAFAVALFEAVYGTTPFLGRDVDELARAKLAGPLRPPTARVEVPRSVAVVLMRALRPAPEDRFADMASLLDALTGPRSRAWIAAPLALGASVAAVLALVLPHRDDPCTPSASSLSSTWNPEVRTTIGLADTTRTRVLDGIDGWSSRWNETWTASCTAGRTGELEATAFDRRMRCLDRRATELATLLEVLVDPAANAQTLDQATSAVPGLGAPESCTDDAALASALVVPEDAAIAARVDHVRNGIARADVLLRTSRFDDALAVLDPMEVEADAIGFAPLQAELAERKGITEWFAGRQTATATLERAEQLASACGHFEMVAQAAAMLAYDAATRFQLERAEHWSTAARTAVVRGELGPEVEIPVLNRLGQLLVVKGDLDRAKQDFGRALALAEAQWGPDDVQVLASLANLANVTRDAGDPQRALALQERARAIAESQLRQGHGDIGQLYGDMGITYAALARHDDAREYFERALALQIEAYGADHMLVASTLANLGINASTRGDVKTAIDYHRRALAVQEKAYGSGQPGTIIELTNLGELLIVEERLDEAAAVIERAVTITADIVRPDDPMARSPQELLGRLRHAQGRPAEAVTALRAALACRETLPEAHARTRFFLAQALWDAGERTEAVILAKQALVVLGALPDDFDRKHIQAWLDSHTAVD